jgi:hypothetical protein
VTRPEFDTWCIQNKACPAAISWMGRNPDMTCCELWDACENHSWLFWVSSGAGILSACHLIRPEHGGIDWMRTTGKEQCDFVRSHISFDDVVAGLGK